MSPEQRALVVLGTRPEAIKLAPVIAELRRSGCHAIVCATAQHRTMLDQVLELFDISGDHDLDLMRDDQALPDLTAAVVSSVSGVIACERPDVVVVQGDTTTTMGAALAAFYGRVPVAHVEAGLRSDDLQAPWPEEMNRRVVSMLSSVHFAPTARARDRLVAERIDPATIAVTGNTVIDALLQTSGRIRSDRALRTRLDEEFASIDAGRRLILVTSHRRESFGRGLEEICRALRILADRSDVQVVYPVHLNPHITGPVHRLLGGHPRIVLVPPVDYVRFVYLLQRSALVLTDSGGVQEEAPSLGRPVLVARDTTERPEGIDAGVAQLVGTRAPAIVAAASRLLDDADAYRAMARATNPYGDGAAAPRIVAFLRQWLRTRATAIAAAAAGT